MVKLLSSRQLSKFRAGFSLPHPNYFGEKIRTFLLTDCHHQVTDLTWN